jgi:dTDP-4-dehydrorhamnose 3,5-epimerase-like enzyme
MRGFFSEVFKESVLREHGIDTPVSPVEALISDKDRKHPILSRLPRFFWYEPPASAGL